MNSSFGACPVCLSQIPEHRLSQGINACEACGWIESRNFHQVENNLQKRTIKAFGIVTALFVGAFIHAVNWDSYFFTIVPLKAKDVIGMASESDLNEIAEICRARKKHECVESTLTTLSVKYGHNLNYLAELGKAYYLNKKFPESVAAYSQFFTKGGNDVNAGFQFAQSLSETGQVDDSIRYFRYVLDSKPDTLQISVTHAFVKMLMKHERYELAEEIIQSIRKQGENTALFMEDRLKEIQTKTGRS